MSIMVLLVGEQPAPNLLPIRFYEPNRVILVHTNLPLSQTRAKRLEKVIGTRAKAEPLETEAYRVGQIQAKIDAYIEEHCTGTEELIFNLTGATKPMVLAAYEIARARQAVGFYYQTENNQNLLHAYHFENGNLVCEAPVSIQATLTLDDYLRLYVGDYRTDRLKEGLERMIEKTLREHLPDYELMTSVKPVELAGNLEIDLIVRHQNQVAVLESKRQGKKGIDQLNSVANQRTLGTYTKKILVSQAPLDSNNQDLAEAYKIQVIELTSARSGTLSREDQELLVQKIRDVMEPKNRDSGD